MKEFRPKALSQDGSASAHLAAAVTGSEARRDDPHSTSVFDYDYDSAAATHKQTKSEDRFRMVR